VVKLWKTQYATNTPIGKKYLAHQWKIRITNKVDMEIVLNGMLPYLRVKREKAVMLLEALKQVKARRILLRRNNIIPR